MAPSLSRKKLCFHSARHETGNRSLSKQKCEMLASNIDMWPPDTCKEVGKQHNKDLKLPLIMSFLLNRIIVSETFQLFPGLKCIHRVQKSPQLLCSKYVNQTMREPFLHPSFTFKHAAGTLCKFGNMCEKEFFTGRIPDDKRSCET